MQGIGRGWRHREDVGCPTFDAPNSEIWVFGEYAKIPDVWNGGVLMGALINLRRGALRCPTPHTPGRWPVRWPVDSSIRSQTIRRLMRWLVRFVDCASRVLFLSLIR